MTSSERFVNMFVRAHVMFCTHCCTHWTFRGVDDLDLAFAYPCLCLFDSADQIKQANYSFDQEVWRSVSETAIDLVKKLLEPDPSKRLTAKQALKHGWFIEQSEDALAQNNISGNLDNLHKMELGR